MADDDSKGLAALKRIVIGMGILLVAGTVLLVMLAVYKGTSKKPAADTANTVSATEETNCRYADVSFFERGQLLDYKVDGNILVLRQSDATGREHLRVIDLCKGSLRQTITIE
ncbi:MAG: hypothetical protein KDD76_01850 [Rickettsiales bacterium]|nr:hypothetical protein [Rickettsiales bacterium]